MNEFRSIPVRLIDQVDRLRPVKEARLHALAADIDVQGLLQPIVVAADGERFTLIAGAYRLSAVDLVLGWDEIPARVIEGADEADRRFAEIMENVNREELSALERAEFLAELDAAWKRLNPAARHGGDRRSANIRAVKQREAEGGDQSAIMALRSEVAEKVGLSRRTFFRALQIARGLTAPAKARLRETPLEDNQSELQKLAALDAKLQAAVCDLLFADPPKAGNVADAEAMARGNARPAAGKNLMSRLNANWDRLPRQERAQFFEARRDEILAHARAEGWI